MQDDSELRLEIGNRLKEARVYLNLTQEQTADAIGSKKTGYQANENGRTYPGGRVISGFIGLGINANWLLTGNGPMLKVDLSASGALIEDMTQDAVLGSAEAAQRRESRYQAYVDGPLSSARDTIDEICHDVDLKLDGHWRDMLATISETYSLNPDHIADIASLVKSEQGIKNEFALVPGYNIEVAAGTGVFPSSEEPTRYLAFRHKWLRYKGLREKDLVLVFTKGDSMEPTISDNNTVLIDTSQRNLIDGHIYVIRTDGHLIVKRIQKLWNKGILLLSDNKEYKEQQVEPNEADDLEVIGKVVWVGKDL